LIPILEEVMLYGSSGEKNRAGKILKLVRR